MPPQSQTEVFPLSIPSCNTEILLLVHPSDYWPFLLAALITLDQISFCVYKLFRTGTSSLDTFMVSSSSPSFCSGLLKCSGSFLADFEGEELVGQSHTGRLLLTTTQQVVSKTHVFPLPSLLENLKSFQVTYTAPLTVLIIYFIIIFSCECFAGEGPSKMTQNLK